MIPFVHKNITQQQIQSANTQEIETINNLNEEYLVVQDNESYEVDNNIDSDKIIHKINHHHTNHKKDKNITAINVVNPLNIKIDSLKIQKNKSVPEHESEKNSETEVIESIELFGTKTENNNKAIVIDITDEEVKKEDHRDKSIIEKTLRHYKYLEFDNDSEIDNLKSGENLRAMLEKQRSLNEEEEIEVLSSFVTDERNQRRKKTHTFSNNKKKDTNKTKQESIVREIKIPDLISIQELANRLSIKITFVIEKAKYIGEHVDGDSVIDGDVAELIVEEFGQKCCALKKNCRRYIRT